jgi:hypothetical protein
MRCYTVLLLSKAAPKFDRCLDRQLGPSRDSP